MNSRLGWAAGLLAASVASVALAAPKDVEVTIDGGKARLHGSLLTPERPHQRTAVLMIAGSGPTDRNSNSAIAAVQPNTLAFWPRPWRRGASRACASISAV